MISPALATPAFLSAPQSLNSNNSGLEAGPARTHPPFNLIGALNLPPDVPSGVTIPLKRISPLHNSEPRYFIAPAGTLQIVSIEKPAPYLGNLSEDIKKWRALLGAPNFNRAATRDILYRRQLSEIPWANAGRCFHAKLRLRTFPWGRALLFITTYVQGKTGGPVNNDMLVLVVQGLTNDGRYAVNGRFEIHHPKLPDSTWDQRTKEKAVFDLDDQTTQAEQWLDHQPDQTFQPTLHQYDLFLQSLQITPPKS
ncbi:hypothetical protein BH09VER1_BH09VER1_55180 [soil metagenome]